MTAVLIGFAVIAAVFAALGLIEWLFVKEDQ